MEGVGRMLLLRAIKKPPGVIAFRGLQELRLIGMRCGGRWRGLEREIAGWWTETRIEDFAASGKRPTVLADGAPKALKAAVADGLLSAADLHGYGSRMRERDFTVLGAKVPADGAMPWHSDWRWDHTWPADYFRNYDFYRQDREHPYDIKIPWELSRLWFVLPALQAAWLDDDAESVVDWVVGVVSDWEQRNPVAYSVGWHPMEASMRGLYLVLALDMLCALGPHRTEALAPLLRLVAKHGEFIGRTVEYSDVRGNHYAANVVALLLIGLTIRGWYPRADRWVDYAVKAIPAEVGLQFVADGVNFEKSTGYHRLVTELFFVGVLAMEGHGFALPAECLERLHLACEYSAACTRPDGLVPNVGDNDDARVLFFDEAVSGDHRAVIGLGAAYWQDADLKGAAGQMPACVPWLLGLGGVDAWRGMVGSRRDGMRHFGDGGVVTARQAGHFLWMDVGEVGMAGRGGHGHNDILSFEVVLGGNPVIVDPGNSVYTGDAALRNLFRSSAYHNGLCVDELEIAPMAGMWQISDVARPCGVEVKSDDARTTIRAGHTGYLRLDDPVLHVRELSLEYDPVVLECNDHLECKGRHQVARHLHLSPDVRVSMEQQCAHLRVGEACWVLRWDAGTAGEVVAGWISPGYGVKAASSIIVLTDSVEGNTSLQFVMEASEVSVG